MEVAAISPSKFAGDAKSFHRNGFIADRCRTGSTRDTTPCTTVSHSRRFSRLNDRRCSSRCLAGADSGKGQGGKGQGGKPRVLCWIATQPANHEAKAKHVKATWGRRCDVLLFFSSRKGTARNFSFLACERDASHRPPSSMNVADPSLPTVALNVTEGRQHLWEKTREAFRYIHRHHLLDADWFLKADDDTYVIVENLRRLLRDSDPSAPVYFGCRFKRFSGPGFMSGGAGYVLSKEALKRFVEKALPDAKACPLAKVKDEDVGMGRCLHAVGVEPGDSRDEKGRWRFLPYSPGSHLSPAPMWNADWVQCNAFHPYTQGRGCCSDRAVSFHYVSPESMHVLEYFIYRLRVDDRR
ncbi:unnamed protein product [Darwinula stevensoni]|uniref:N-acetylgalactosaminide beta-1,3-galactosyltransferase n=1 Tax=Darwinula stevensoni TaxID=69355 RepID=A0A7R9AEW9_9CRUS|nr:unnamed protein product [Darwinula stevensoni]CAG0902743.1 unnamed protein product [Darwinula stevensoni]